MCIRDRLWEDRSGNYTAYVTGGTYSNLQGTEELSTVLQECLTQKQEEGTLRTYNPVSYTHLDVYKRQGRGTG